MRQLEEARLLRRYKRFLADVELPTGEQITVHCPNTGSMKNCVEAGAKVWLSKSDNPKRKHAYTWELIRTDRGHTIGINTGKANKLVEDAVCSSLIPGLDGYADIRREVAYGNEGSRIDLLLREGRKPDSYVEVKSVTLLEEPVSQGVGYFPDAVSERGAKHLRELRAMVDNGARGVLFFCVQHTGVQEVRPADHVDPGYGQLLREVVEAGVEVLAWKVRLTPSGFRLWREVPVCLP